MEVNAASPANAHKKRQDAFERGVYAAQHKSEKEIESMARKYDDPDERQMFLDGVAKGKKRSSFEK
jgi:hypothetical protein